MKGIPRDTPVPKVEAPHMEQPPKKKSRTIEEELLNFA